MGFHIILGHNKVNNGFLKHNLRHSLTHDIMFKL